MTGGWTSGHVLRSTLPPPPTVGCRPLKTCQNRCRSSGAVELWNSFQNKADIQREMVCLQFTQVFKLSVSRNKKHFIVAADTALLMCEFFSYCFCGNTAQQTGLEDPRHAGSPSDTQDSAVKESHL
ncbi:hypothetical protein EYF80_016696 [Liparis tanakae]|uniref:Uncharacterized protein n=1 Tax=Liparis tanakae TaxID=230148 RepID=A0A4Z2I4N3_9TELE|nr:hypothetical protein EYF80_016696 [Liparis tanakae]